MFTPQCFVWKQSFVMVTDNFDALIVQGKRGVSNHTQMCVTQSRRPEENEKNYETWLENWNENLVLLMTCTF